MADVRTLPRELVVERPAATFRQCIYCGRPSIGVACRTHRDLLVVDPHQQECRLRDDR